VVRAVVRSAGVPPLRLHQRTVASAVKPLRRRAHCGAGDQVFVREFSGGFEFTSTFQHKHDR
jgi:hypothetical protein